MIFAREFFLLLKYLSDSAVPLKMFNSLLLERVYVPSASQPSL